MNVNTKEVDFLTQHLSTNGGGVNVNFMPVALVQVDLKLK